MKERKGLVTMHGDPLILLGDELSVGGAAPDFEVVANDLSPVKFSLFKGRTCIISSVPSLDTSVCDIMTRRFNTEADNLGKDVIVLTISMDLPFAQQRWCGAADVKAVRTLSDHRSASFGIAYGVLIKDIRLLARAIFVVDSAGVIQYIEIVPELTNEPDYAAAIAAAKDTL